MKSINKIQKDLVLAIAAFVLSIFLLSVSLQPAAAACGGNTTVSNETELNAAIVAFNGVVTSPCVFTITLTQDINLTASTTIINNSTAGVELIIDGDGFTLDGQKNADVRPINITFVTFVTINELTVTGGFIDSPTTLPQDDGAGIRNDGTLTLNNSTVTDNETNPASYGGGIANGGTLVINNSTISNNYANNWGGGIYNNGDLTLNQSTVIGNEAGASGGGIKHNSTVAAAIIESTITDNTAASSGGGVDNTGDGMTINNSTISGNTAPSGGGIFNALVTLTIDSTTITGNDGAALYEEQAQGSVSITNSILANSVGADDCVTAIGGTVNDGGSNLVESQNSCSFTLSADPMLGPLADNGGPTQTHALLNGSPAIDNGSTSLTSDQRGAARPFGSADDIGAFEGVVADYGDAPASYGIAGAFPSALIYLGLVSADEEAASLHSTNADGDNLDNTNDEDGVSSFPPLTASTTSYSVDVLLTKNSSNAGGIKANVYSCIDFDNNGMFSNDEVAVYTNVPANSTDLTITLNWSGITVDSGAALIYARFRIENGPLADDGGTPDVDERCLGLATEGEVEDYTIEGTTAINLSSLTANVVSNGGVGSQSFLPALILISLFSIATGVLAWSIRRRSIS